MKQLKSRFLIALVLGLSAGVGSICYFRLQQSEPLSFVLKKPDGSEFSSSQLQGRRSLIHFWAAWCTPCLAEIPTLVEVAGRAKDSQVQFVMISLDSAWSEAEKVLPSRQLPSNMVSLINPDRSVAERFGTFQYPETYFLGADGKVIRKLVGPQEWDKFNLNN